MQVLHKLREEVRLVRYHLRIEEYEQALKEWEETRPPGSASSVDPFGHYKQKFEERQQAVCLQNVWEIVLHLAV